MITYIKGESRPYKVMVIKQTPSTITLSYYIIIQYHIIVLAPILYVFVREMILCLLQEVIAKKVGMQILQQVILFKMRF